MKDETVAVRPRTWMFEALVVGAILAGVAVARHRAVEWIGAGAVLASFMHAQVADRMAEKQAAMAEPDVECWRWARRYFVAKEVMWFAYFVVLGAWSALVGVGVFLAYPIWRKYWRSR